MRLTFPSSRWFRKLGPASLFLVLINLHAEPPISLILNGAAEVPPVNTVAKGTAMIDVQPNRMVRGEIKTSGLLPTMAHIHEAPIGKNGPPIVTLTRTLDDSFSVPADTRLSESQYASYLAGNLYLNVHSAAHPEGEIRAQLPGKPLRLAH